MLMAMRLAAAGTQVGLTESQILGFATALSSVGIEAEMGGSAFSKALVKMEVAAATGGEALEDFAKVSGMTADQFKALWDADPAAAFQAFIVGLSQMDEQGMSAIATLEEIGISEIRLRDTLLRATNATELFAETQVMANAAWEDNSALVEEAGKRYQTTASKLTNLKNKAVLFGQQIGDDLNPTIQELIEGADDLLDSFLDMDEAQRQQIIKWAAIAAATGPALLGISKVSKGISVFTEGIGKFATAVGKAGGGFKGFMSVLGKSPSVWLAVATAVVVGTIALADYVSGAKQAREALEGMAETAENWKDTAAETFYGNSEGLSFFGMSESDFTNEAQTAEEWLSGLLTVWTDGQKETDEIVSEWTESFKTLTANTRNALTELKATADANGYTGVSAQLQADIDQLDAIDQEIERLLRKRQNGYFSEGDQIRLQELIDTREAIVVKRYTGSTWVAAGAQEVKASGITIGLNNVAITTENFLLQLLDPGDNENVLMEMSANGNVGFKQLYADEVISDSVAQSYAGSSWLWVEPSIETPTETDFRSLGEAVQSLNNKYLPFDVTIYLPWGWETYEPSGVSIRGITGPGKLTIYGYGESSILNSYIKVHGCFSHICFQNVYLRESRTLNGSSRQPYLCEVTKCHFVEFSSCTLDGPGMRYRRCLCNSWLGRRCEDTGVCQKKEKSRVAVRRI